MVRAGEAAELLCAGLRVAAEVRAVSAGRVLAALHPPGTSVSLLPGAGVSAVRSALLLSVCVSAPVGGACESACVGR